MEENKKKKIVGNKTFGVMLIILGIIFIVGMFTGITFVKYTYVLWPIFLILLGAEILYYSSKDNIEIKYNFWTMFYMGIILMIALGVSIAALAMDLLFSQKEVRDNIAKTSEIVSQDLREEALERYARHNGIQPIIVE